MANTNVLATQENRGFIEKSKEKMEILRQKYKEKFVDTGKSVAIENTTDDAVKAIQAAVGVVGGIATVVMTLCPVDGPVGEIVTALATPALMALVPVALKVREKVFITGKRIIEKYILKVDPNTYEGSKVSGYNLEDGEIVKDFEETILGAKDLAKGASK